MATAPQKATRTQDKVVSPTPGSNLSPLDIAGEALKTGLPGGDDNQFLVFPQEGTTYVLFNGQDYCGMHADNIGGVIFGLVRYASDDPTSDPVNHNALIPNLDYALFNDMAWFAVHEFAEMVTDPRYFIPIRDTPAWKTNSSSLVPTEVADLCEHQYPDASTPTTTFASSLSYPNTYHFYLPPLWSNYVSDPNKCVTSAGKEFASPDNIPPFNGIHTVQGSILTKYQTVMSLMGSPLTEETPIAGGAVSYFYTRFAMADTSLARVMTRPSVPRPVGVPFTMVGARNYEVHGCIYQEYASVLGGPTGPFGFPVSDEYATPQGRESDFQHGSITDDNVKGMRVHLGGETPSVASNENGRLEVFWWGSDGALLHKWQLSSGGWSGWASLGGALASPPVVMPNDDGSLEAFARGTDGALWCIRQLTPGGSWSGWTSLSLTPSGPFRGNPAVGWNVSGKLEVFVRGSDDALWHKWQLTPGGNWSAWYSLGGTLTSSPTVDFNVDGRLEVFVRGSDGALWQRWQTTAGGSWSGWSSLGVPSGKTLAGDPILTRNYDGRLEVFVRGSDGRSGTAGKPRAGAAGQAGIPWVEPSWIRQRRGSIFLPAPWKSLCAGLMGRFGTTCKPQGAATVGRGGSP